MRKLLTLLFILGTFSLLKAEAQAGGKLLWQLSFNLETLNDYYRPGCLGPRPHGSAVVEVCFVEKFRKKSTEKIEANILYFSRGITQRLKVVDVSEWKFLYTSTGHAFNSNFYEQKILVQDEAGRQSELVQIFFPYNAGMGRFLSFKSITGQLPNGDRLPLLNNHYMSPAFIKGY